MMALRIPVILFVLLVAGGLMTAYGQLRTITHICQEGWTTLDVGIDPNILQTRGLVFCVKAFNVPATWSGAQDQCIDEGGFLLVLDPDWFGVPIEPASESIRSFAANQRLGDFWTSARVTNEYLWWMVDTPQPVDAPTTATWLWAASHPDVTVGKCGQATTSTQDSVSATEEVTRATPFYMRLKRCQDRLPFICINKGIDYIAREVPQCDPHWYGSIYADTCVSYDANVEASFDGAKTKCEQKGGQLSVPLTDAINNLTASVIQVSDSGSPGDDGPGIDRYDCYSCTSTMNVEACFSQTVGCDYESACETMYFSTPRGTYHSMGCVPRGSCGNQPAPNVELCQGDEECQLSSTCCQGHLCNREVEDPNLATRRRRRSYLSLTTRQAVPTSWIGGQMTTEGIQWVDGSTTDVSSGRLNPSYESAESGCVAIDPTNPLDQEWIVISACTMLFPFVCQKPAQPGNYGVKITDHPENLWYRVNDITRNIGSNSHPFLVCQAKNYHPTLEVIWVKDGHFISNDLAPSGLSLMVNYDLAGKLPPSVDFTAARLQGYYRCMVWGFDPLESVISKRALVRFYDVSTFQALIKLPTERYNPEFTKSRLQHIWPREEDSIYSPMIKDLMKISDLELIPNIFINGYSEGSLVINATVYFTLHDNSLAVLWPLTGHTGDITSYPAEFVSQQLEEVVYRQMMQSVDLRLAGKGPTASWYNKYRQYNITMDDVIVRGTAHCPERVVLAGDAVYTIPSTPVGAVGTSSQVCFSDGASMASCYCRGDFTSGALWGEAEVYQNCEEPPSSPVTEVLHNLSQQVVTEHNAMEVAQEVEVVTSDASILQPVDVILTSNVLENIVGVRDLGQEVGAVVASSVSNIMEVPQAVLIESQKINQANSRILKSLDTFASSCNSSGVSIVETRVALEVLPVNDLSTSGLLILSGIHDLFNRDNVQTSPNGSDVSTPDVSAAIKISDEVLALARQAQVKWQELLDRTTNPELRAKIESDPVRLSFMAFQNGELFLSPSQLDADRVVVAGANSMVVSASLHGYGVSVTNLSDPISTTFHPVHNTSADDFCVFWDFQANDGLGDWSRDGCWLAGIEDGRVTCSCNHLTNFAILTDIERGRLSAADALALSLITYVGLALSIAGLTFTVLSFIVFKKLRKGRSHKTLLNLAIALLCAYIIFIAGINQTANKHGCMAVAALLTYFLLASFAWMLVEGVLQYLLFFKVFNTYIENFMWKTMIPAWGLPAVPVIATAAYDYNLFFGHEEYCWLHNDPFIYGFLIPVCAVIVINTVLYVIVIRSITCGRSTIRSSQSNSKVKVMQFRASITCFVVLGLTWVFGILAVADARVPFQYLFCIFNSIQGFLIFIFHVIRERSVRESWWSCCCPGDAPQRKFSSAVSESQGTKTTGLTSVHKPSVQYDNVKLDLKNKI